MAWFLLFSAGLVVGFCAGSLAGWRIAIWAIAERLRARK